METELDAFGNVLAEVENLMPPPAPGGTGGAEPLPPITLFYFCIPGNDKLLDYWDRVERNLFNLRHCRDIEGVERPIPLFSPPIDPAMLVRAAAAGIDLSTLAGGAAAALPHYRFRYVLQRAYSFVAEVQRLGSGLLSALERRDDAALAALRETQVEELRRLMKDIAKTRKDDAKAELDRLKEAQKLVEIREKYYAKKSENQLSTAETVGFASKFYSFSLKVMAALTDLFAAGAHAVPDFQAGGSGIGGSPHGTVKAGGKQVGDATGKAAKNMKTVADVLDKGAELMFKAQYFADRHSKYKHQHDLAEQELVEVDKQIAVADIRLAIAEQEIDAETLQIEQAEAIQTFLKSRYTDEELYEWLISHISTVYFQAYQTAYDMALAAAACAEREVGLVGADYVSFGYWDSLRKGLMSGERLAQDLRRLEAAYIDRNKRTYEISKDISVALLDAEALLTLRATGSCEIEVPELLYDSDYPGHYRRRIKSVALTLPTVAGPYTSVNCKLTLLRDETRMTTSLDPTYARDLQNDDTRFADNWAATRAIVTSKAQNDPGLFALDLDDDRYLPFEGAGAVGRWRIDLPADTNAFDLDTVSDAILHIRYTAEEGGEQLATAARAAASARPVAQSAKLMRLDQVFAAAWQGLIDPPPAGQDQSMTIPFTADRLPYLDRMRSLRVTSIGLSAIGASGDLVAEIAAPGGVSSTFDLEADANLAGRISGDTGGDLAAGVALGDFTLKLRRSTAVDFRGLSAADLAGLYAVITYEGTL